jgi:hypothetical protein
MQDCETGVSSSDYPHGPRLAHSQLPRNGLPLGNRANVIFALRVADEPLAITREFANSPASGMQAMGGHLDWRLKIGESIVGGTIQREGRSAPWPSGRV